MKTNKIRRNFIARILMLAMGIGAFIGCSEREIPLTTTSDVLIATYIEQDSTLSDFYKILEATGFDGFLNAYGVYTCFAPTNEAIKQYAVANGKTSWQDFSTDELKKLVSLHVISDYFKTSSFSDGKMAKATMAGDYLTSTVKVDANNMAQIAISADNITKAGIIKSNVELGNGILHEIDKVLVPPTMTLAQIVENMRAQGFSIFADAVVATGLNDTLSKVNIGASDTLRRWFTVLAESDAVFQANGINSLDDLKAKFSTKGDPKDPTDSLYIFMAYRILTGASFLADFAKNDTSAYGMDSYKTLVPGENTLIKRIPNSESIDVVLERDKFMKITSSLPFVRTQCDLKATNGVFHVVNGQYKITVKYPTPVYWEITEYPEIMSNPLYSGTSAGSINIGNGLVSGISMDIAYKGSTIAYEKVTQSNTGNWPVIPTHGDWFNFQLKSNVLRSVTFLTPEIIKGKYKIWVCYRSSGYSSKGRFNRGKIVWDDTITMPNVINNQTTVDYANKSESQLESEGYKTYLAPAMNHKSYVGQYIGSVDLKSTKRHTMKFIALDAGVDIRQTYLDMIHFIPIDMDQIWPKFDQNGKMVTRQDAGL